MKIMKACQENIKIVKKKNNIKIKFSLNQMSKCEQHVNCAVF